MVRISSVAVRVVVRIAVRVTVRVVVRISVRVAVKDPKTSQVSYTQVAGVLPEGTNTYT